MPRLDGTTTPLTPRLCANFLAPTTLRCLYPELSFVTMNVLSLLPWLQPCPMTSRTVLLSYYLDFPWRYPASMHMQNRHKLLAKCSCRRHHSSPPEAPREHRLAIVSRFLFRLNTVYSHISLLYTSSGVLSVVPTAWTNSCSIVKERGWWRLIVSPTLRSVLETSDVSKQWLFCAGLQKWLKAFVQKLTIVSPKLESSVSAREPPLQKWRGAGFLCRSLAGRKRYFLKSGAQYAYIWSAMVRVRLRIFCFQKTRRALTASAAFYREFRDTRIGTLIMDIYLFTIFFFFFWILPSLS